VTTKRGKRETVRGDARVDVRAFFLLGSGPSREKSRVSRKSRHSRRRSPASSAERVVFRGGASLELFAPSVRPRARSPCSRRLRRRNTPAQKIVLEQVFFTNRSLEASWVNSVRSSPRRVVVSAPFKKKTRAPVGQKWKIDAFAKVAFGFASSMDPSRGRSRRREGGLAAVSASRARAAASAVRSEVNSCYPIVRKPAKALVGLGRHALSSHRASEAAAAAPRRETRARRASGERAAALPVAGGDTTRAPHVPHASRAGSMRDATIACRSRRTRGAPRGARAIV
jgi:hypothetical protein